MKRKTLIGAALIFLGVFIFIFGMFSSAGLVTMWPDMADVDMADVFDWAWFRYWRWMTIAAICITGLIVWAKGISTIT